MEHVKDAPAGAKIGYVLDKYSRTFSAGSCAAIQEMAARSDPDFKEGLGVLFLTGPEYQDPAVLAGSISARPLDSIVAIYDEERDTMALCRYGDGPDGIQLVLDVLKGAAENGQTSWEALHAAVNWEEKQ